MKPGTPLIDRETHERYTFVALAADRKHLIVMHQQRGRCLVRKSRLVPTAVYKR